MSQLKEEISEKLKKERPNISASSIRTYTSLLNSIYNKSSGKDGVKWFDDVEEVIKNIEKLPELQTRKTIGSASFILTGNDKYKEYFKSISQQVTEKYKSGEINEKRKPIQDGVTFENTIMPKFQELEQQATKDKKNIEIWMKYITVGLMGGVWLPPRRTGDYALMEWGTDIQNGNKCDLNKGIFAFNLYKTAYAQKKKTGSTLDVVPINDTLLKILKQWRKINKHSHFVYNLNTGEPFNADTYGKYISSIFGKEGFSGDVLRSVFVNKKGGVADLHKQLEEMTGDMGTTPSSAITYYRKEERKEEPANK